MQFGKMAGFGAFLEGKVLNQSSEIFSNFGAEKPPLRQAAGTLVAIKKTKYGTLLFHSKKRRKTRSL